MVEISPFTSDQVVSDGASPIEAFFFLPEHIRICDGSVIELKVRDTENINRSNFNLRINETRLETIRSTDARHLINSPVIQIARGNLKVGWNKLTVAYATDANPMQKRFLLEKESSLRIAYQRMPLFPELQRFPQTFAQERLLKTSSVGNPTEPVIGILLPPHLRDAHFRALGIVAARLGQCTYLEQQDCRLGRLEEFSSESTLRNGILLGTREELSKLSLPAPLLSQLEKLKEGMGFISEWITPGISASSPQHRWMIVAGADNLGLDKAALALGNSYTLETATSFPMIIETAPIIPDWMIKSVSSSPQGSEIMSLDRLSDFLLQDALARRAAILIPQDSSNEQIAFLIKLMLKLGHDLSSAPVLWPEVCSYNALENPPAARLDGRSVLLLGSLSQWKEALPPNFRLPVQATDETGTMVTMRGQKVATTTFEPTLVWVQMVASPWSKEQKLVILGGWNDFSNLGAERLFDPQVCKNLTYQVGAIDASGRCFSYNFRNLKQDSLANTLQKLVPKGLTVEKTRELAESIKFKVARVSRQNKILAVSAFMILIGGAVVQLMLLRARNNRRRKVNRISE